MNLSMDPDVSLPRLADSRIPKASLMLESEIFPAMVIDTLDEVHLDPECRKMPHTVMINFNRESIKAHRRYFERNARNELCAQKWLRRIFTFNSNEVPYYSALVLKMEQEECYLICCDEALLLPADVRESLKTLNPFQNHVPKIPNLCEDLVIDCIVKSLERAVGLFQAWEQKLGIKMKVGFFIPPNPDVVHISSAKEMKQATGMQVLLEPEDTEIVDRGTKIIEMDSRPSDKTSLSKIEDVVFPQTLKDMGTGPNTSVRQEKEKIHSSLFHSQPLVSEIEDTKTIDKAVMRGIANKPSTRASSRTLIWLKTKLIPCICIPDMPVIEEDGDHLSQGSNTNIEVTAQLELNGPSQVIAFPHIKLKK